MTAERFTVLSFVAAIVLLGFIIGLIDTAAVIGVGGLWLVSVTVYQSYLDEQEQ